MSQKQSSNPEFIERIHRKGVVLANFTADWSTPCLSQIPVINQTSKRYKRKISINVIDVDEYRNLATSFRITSIPTLILFKNGKEVNRLVGLQKADVLSAAIDNLLD